MLSSILSGRDVLGILPTGGGKSLVYQLASQVLPALTVVVSPLIALMRDQLESAQQVGIRAVVINSTLSEHDREDALNEVASGDAKLLYVTPEGAEDQASI
jgi:ATP-dependent DNA helicase RecQ